MADLAGEVGVDRGIGGHDRGIVGLPGQPVDQRRDLAVATVALADRGLQKRADCRSAGRHIGDPDQFVAQRGQRRDLLAGEFGRTVGVALEAFEHEDHPEGLATDEFAFGRRDHVAAQHLDHPVD